ncbi:MAG: 30S ribosomal protein S11 [Candidatus Levybacteria bacterium]|nr:30S ribosomal protein S11 [Candidatus Levybacteria bacterium]
MAEKKSVKGQSASGRKKIGVKVSPKGRVYITSTFNNTLITITNEQGDTVAWGSSGGAGFKGTRKSTPYAATVAMEQAAKRAIVDGIKSVDVFVKGPGSGRDSALRAIKAVGMSITSIADITPIPHNGPRAKKKRRV